MNINPGGGEGLCGGKKEIIIMNLAGRGATQFLFQKLCMCIAIFPLMLLLIVHDQHGITIVKIKMK